MKPEEAITCIKTLCGTCKFFPKCVNTKPECFQAIEAAIFALEKRIPKEPVEGYVFNSAWREHLAKVRPEIAKQKGSCCPFCGEHVGESELTLKKKNYHQYCKWCGQALKQPEEVIK